MSWDAVVLGSAHLDAHGVRKSGSAFYQLMARLEDGGMVREWYEQEVVDGQIILARQPGILHEGHGRRRKEEP